MHPRSLLLLDGTGALVSAGLLGWVLPQFPAFFGMPLPALYFLAVWPVLFAGYDFIVLWRRPANYVPYLRAIALANVSYCLLSIGTLCYHARTLSGWDWAYFGSEVTIVLVLAGLEWRTAGR